MSQDSTEIVEAPLVSPADPKLVLEALRRFEEFKKKALSSNDYVILETKEGKRAYLKKSAWMKFALACQLSLEKRDERLDILPDGSKVYYFTFRAQAPNGRFADAVGSAATSERNFAHPDHDVRALAQTRATNRCISNLVSGGEVSAEEMVSEVHEASGISPPPESPVPQVASPSPAGGIKQTPQVPPATKPGPEKPTAWKVPLTANQPTPGMVAGGVRWFPLLRGTQSFGAVNQFEDEISVVPEKPVRLDTALVDGFLLRKIVEPLVAKHGLAYTVKRTSNGLLEAVLIRGKLPDLQVRELVSGARWAFEKALEGNRP